MSDDLRFDQLLREDASALSPAMAEVNPWREAMALVLWGMGLTTITFNFLYLDMLLPALGGILMVLGFRTLRRENKALQWCWRLSIAAATVRSASFALAALPVDVKNIPAYAVMVMTFALYCCLWRGMVGVSRAAGAEKSAAPAAGALVIFYAVMCALAFMELSGWLAVLPVLIVYIVILRKLVKLARSLSDTGYAIHAAPVRLPSAAVLWGYLGLTLAAVLLAMFLGQRYPMDWQVRDDVPQDTAIRAELLTLGFPEQVLDDLTAEETARMSGAVKVYAETEPLYEDDTYREVTTSVWNDDTPPRWHYIDAEKQPDGSYRYHYRAYDLYKGFVTHVVVLVEEAGRQRAVVLHHVTIGQPDVACRSECIELWPLWQDNKESWSPGGWNSGRLLCEKDGQSYAADFYSVEGGGYEFTDFLGANRRSSIVARWSRMDHSENIRAYLLYDAEMLTPELPWLYSWCNYVRQTKPVYPFRDALTLWHEWNTDGCYEKWQTFIRHWPDPTDETE